MDAYLDKVLTHREDDGTSWETQVAVKKLLENYREAERTMMERYGSNKVALTCDNPGVRG